jgi:hypothetical protein
MKAVRTLVKLKSLLNILFVSSGDETKLFVIPE